MKEKKKENTVKISCYQEKKKENAVNMSIINTRRRNKQKKSSVKIS